MPAIAVVAAAGPSPEPCERRLEEAGRVSYERFPTAGARDLGGMTWFHFDHRQTFTWRHAVREGPGVRELEIEPGVRIVVDVRHTVRLPDVADSLAWFRRLRRHELDHVALSTDERPRLLLQWLAAHLGTVRRPVAPATVVTQEVVSRAINEEIQERAARVTRLVQAAYDSLDRATGHGSRPLPDRDAFFAGIYGREGLERLGFPRVDEVREMLALARYRNAPRGRCDRSSRPHAPCARRLATARGARLARPESGG